MTDQQQLHLSIIRHFRPDWGKTVRECETCGGTTWIGQDSTHRCNKCFNGSVFREWLECGKCEARGRFDDFWRSTKCPACKGKGRIPDAEGRRWIAEAVWHWAQTSDSVDTSDKPWIGIGSWDLRRNQPWRSALETHVRNYTPTPPDLRTPEGCEFLKRLLREAGIGYGIVKEPDRDGINAWVETDDRLYEVEDLSTEPAALLAACVVAMRGANDVTQGGAAQVVNSSSLTVEEAQRLDVCRVCQKERKASSGNPFVMNYGKEYAHQKCLDIA